MGGITGKYNADFTSVIEFFNIPYAQPPVGDLRFKAPVPIDQWDTGHLNAIEYGKACISVDITDPSIAVWIILNL